MYIKIPPQQIASAAGELMKISDDLAALSREAESIRKAIGNCYQSAGAAHSQMYTAVSQITRDRNAVLERGVDGFANAAHIYETIEEEIRARSTETVSAIENGYRVEWSSRPSVSAVLAGTVGVYAGVATAFKNSWVTQQTIAAEPTLNQRLFGNTLGTALDNVKANYDNHGFFYDVAQYGKCALKAAKGVAKIATGVAAIGLSGGILAASPVSYLSIISGANDVFNSVMDATHVYTDEYDKVGKTNALKDALVEGGGILGKAVGNEALGATLGRVTYNSIDLITSLNTLGLKMDKITQLNSTDFGKLGDELESLTGVVTPKIWTTDLETIRYNATLAGFGLKETTNLVENIGELLNVGKSAFSFGKNVNSMIGAFAGTDDLANPVLDAYDSTVGAAEKAGKAFNAGKTAIRILNGTYESGVTWGEFGGEWGWWST